MGKGLVFILFLSFFSICHAQQDTVIRRISGKPFLKISSNSSLIFPGLSTGVGIPAGNGRFNSIGKRKSVSVYARYRIISVNLSWYHHPDFHDNIYLTSEWIMRRERETGFFSEFSSGAGISRTILGGTTYSVDNLGSVLKIAGAGYFYGLITIGAATGYDFSVRNKNCLLVFSRVNLIAMFPYNSSIYLRPVLELGVEFPASIIIQRKSKEVR
jgi:hypothetical protein